MIKRFKALFNKVIGNLFKKKKDLKIGLYGPPNGGKTTLANRICEDWLGESLGSISSVAHETREVQVKDKVHIKAKGKQITFNLVDTPGIATKIDYEEFLEEGMEETEAKTRAKEATKGVVDAIKWLEQVDTVVVVLDSTLDPYSQVNITIMGNLEARKVPVLIVANKVDLKESDMKRIESAFPQYNIVGISAKFGKNIDNFYEELVNLVN